MKTFKLKKEFKLFKKSFLNTEKDIEFALKLFKKVYENSDNLDKDVQSKILNWDIERIAPIDKIIIKILCYTNVKKIISKSLFKIMDFI